jgi:hypothetical protein
MLPLPKRGNVPQTLCHRALPAIMLPRYLILRKTLFVVLPFFLEVSRIIPISFCLIYVFFELFFLFPWLFQGKFVYLPSVRGEIRTNEEAFAIISR